MKIVISGGGPAGATAAYWLASQGMDVTVLEKTTYPREKVCGDGLTPRAVREIQRMGLPHGPEHGYKTNVGLRVRAGERVVELPWPVLTDFPAYGLVRTREGFDHHLAQYARAAGAVIHEHRSVTGVVRDDRGRVVGLETNVLDQQGRRTGQTEVYRADLVLACDGVSSRTAVSAGLYRRTDRLMGVAVRAYYESVRTDLEWMEGWLELTDGTRSSRDVLPGYGWIFGVGDGTANVGLGILNTSSAFGRIDYKQVLAHWTASLPAEWTITPEHQKGRALSAALPMAFNRTPHWIPGMLLLGDSAGLVSAFNGEGISNAMESARYAAEHIVEAAYANGPAQRDAVLARYPLRLRQEWGAHITQGRLLAQAIGHPRIMKAAVATGFSVPPLMRFVLQTMTELTDRPARTWSDRVVAIFDALTPPTGNQ